MLDYRTITAVRRSGEVSFGERIKLRTRGFSFTDGVELPRELSFVLVLRDGRVTAFQTDDGAAITQLAPLNIGSLSPSHSEDRLLVSLQQCPSR